MALLNLSINLMSYLDLTRSDTPRQRMQDYSVSFQGIPTGIPQQLPIELAPGQTQTFVNNARTLSFNGSTSFAIAIIANTSKVRLQGNFGVRTARVDGDGTTVWLVTQNNVTTRFTYSAGTLPTFAGMSVGDGITIEATSPFSPFNQGDFVLTAVGSNYVEFQNPIGVGETQTAQVEIYSSGSVQPGDSLDLRDLGFSYQNRGTFTISRVTDLYVEFQNPNASAQSGITGVTALNIYTQSYNWMMLACDQKVICRLNGDSGSTVEVEPPTLGDLAGNPGLLLKRGRTYSVTVYNPGINKATGFVWISA